MKKYILLCLILFNESYAAVNTTENKQSFNRIFLAINSVFQQAAKRHIPMNFLDINLINKIDAILSLNDINTLYENDETLLKFIIFKGNLAATKYLISSKADVNLPLIGDTPLFIAIENKFNDIAELLIESGANTKVLFDNNNSYLHVSILLNNQYMAKHLINLKLCINNKNKLGQTPLHLAVLLGQTDIISALIKAKANINAKDSNSNTPLHVAVKNGYVSIVKMLLEANANVYCTNSDFQTPLDSISDNPFVKISNLLFDRENI